MRCGPTSAAPATTSSSRRNCGTFRNPPCSATSPRDLNTLGQLLQATNRLGEAEPLMRRPVVIFLRFERDTGHPHPHRDAALNNYTRLLQRMGKSAAEIAAEVQAIRRDAGLV